MATRLKTVHYAFPTLATLVNNTLTTLTQRTIYLPETGTKTFRSVIAHVSFDDIVTATGGTLTTKTLNLRLGAAGYTSVSNTQTFANSGENCSFHLAADFTSHFAANWSGTSMTCDFQLQINQSTGTTLGLVNVSVTLEITYEYDDSSTTQVKSVLIPLDAPAGALSTTAATVDTFPALDSYLPEVSKVYRDIYVVVQGNEGRNAATTDHTLTISVGATSVTSENYEGALASDRWFRYVFDILAAGFAGAGSTQNFQLSASVARCNHLQAYAVVTYEYDESASTSIMQSLMLPFADGGSMGGTTSADYTRITQDLWIEEPGTITTGRVAAYAFWTQNAATPGFLRLGAGSFVGITDAASMMCGGNGCMVRNDSAFTLARGRNTLNLDAYSSHTVNIGFSFCGFFLVNYTSGKHASGSGVHNKTVLWGIMSLPTTALASVWRSSAVAPVIPETTYFINNPGVRMIVMCSSQMGGLSILAERLDTESYHSFERVRGDNAFSDSEAGVNHVFAIASGLFKRFTGDIRTERMDIENDRIWMVTFGNQSWVYLQHVLTYHSITKTVSGSVSGSDGGTVAVHLCHAASGERMQSTSRSGDGAYSFTHFDDTEEMFTESSDASGNVGRSQAALAT